MKNLLDSLEITDLTATLGPIAVNGQQAATLAVSVEELDADSVDVEILGYDPIADDTWSILAYSVTATGVTPLLIGRRIVSGDTAANLKLPTAVKVTLVATGGNEAATVSLDARGLVPNDLAVDVEEAPVGNNTVVLLHGEGDNGVPATTDEMGNTVSFSGTANIDGGVFKFGAASIKLETTFDLVYTSALDPTIAQASWTLEAFIRCQAGARGIIRLSNNASSKLAEIILDESSNALEMYVDGAATPDFVSETDSPSVSSNTWYHVALVKDGTSYYGYLNGDKLLTATDATAIADDLTEVHLYTDGFGTSAWFDEVRYSAVARYTAASFTPPAAPFEVD